MEHIFNGEILKLLRKSKNTSQKTLCEAINISQGTLSKIEQGLMQPLESLVTVLADYFEVKPDFFFQNEEQYSAAYPYHRCRTTLQIADRDRVEAIGNLYRIHIKKLLDAVDIAYKFVPIPSADATPQEIAKLTRRNLGLAKGPIKNLTKLVEDNGIFIIFYNFDTKALDGFTMQNSKDLLPIIFLNLQFPGERIRFTEAHELGHHIMHQVIQNPENIEDEANQFAAEFLMPADDIIDDLRYIGTYKLNMEKMLSLKMKWKVSMNALLKRAIDLNVITENQNRYFWMQMSKSGYRTSEPYPLPLEQPSLLKELIETYKTDLGYSYNELAELLQISKNNFLKLFEEDQPKIRLVR
jgi:Zn-dependent peptidase ImmA (M78 family)/transcriptional regulator with XRE-family HTH domain